MRDRAVDEDAFPRSIVVGHDGSSGAAAAATVAKELAHRFDAVLRIVVATGGDPVLIDSLPREDELEWSTLLAHQRRSTAVSDEADLLVVGSRGLRGMRALGSVSERVGHLARCSVLVVREPLRCHRADPVATTPSPTPSAEHSPGTLMHAAGSSPLSYEWRHSCARSRDPASSPQQSSSTSASRNLTAAPPPSVLER